MRNSRIRPYRIISTLTTFKEKILESALGLCVRALRCFTKRNFKYCIDFLDFIAIKLSLTYQKFCDTVHNSPCPYSLPKRRTGGSETQAADNHTKKMTANIFRGDETDEYSKGRVIA